VSSNHLDGTARWRGALLNTRNMDLKKALLKSMNTQIESLLRFKANLVASSHTPEWC